MNMLSRFFSTEEREGRRKMADTAGRRSPSAAALVVEERTYNYQSQASRTGSPGRPLTARQSRRIRHKRNRHGR